MWQIQESNSKNGFKNGHEGTDKHTRVLQSCKSGLCQCGWSWRRYNSKKGDGYFCNFREPVANNQLQASPVTDWLPEVWVSVNVLIPTLRLLSDSLRIFIGPADKRAKIHQTHTRLTQVFFLLFIIVCLSVYILTKKFLFLFNKAWYILCWGTPSLYLTSWINACLCLTFGFTATNHFSSVSIEFKDFLFFFLCQTEGWRIVLGLFQPVDLPCTFYCFSTPFHQTLDTQWDQDSWVPWPLLQKYVPHRKPSLSSPCPTHTILDIAF